MNEVFVLTVSFGGDVDTRVFRTRSAADAAFMETIRDAEQYFADDLTEAIEDDAVYYADFSAKVEELEVEG